MRLTVQIPPRSAAVIERFRHMPERLLPAIAHGLDRAAQAIIGHAQRMRFRGKGPFPPQEHRLGVRTHRLRDSLSALPAEVDPEGVRVRIGSDVVYFGPHEFGFAGAVQVREHRRVIRRGKRQAKIVSVRAHQRTMRLPERAPLRYSVLDELPAIERELVRAIDRLAAEGRID